MVDVGPLRLFLQKVGLALFGLALAVILAEAAARMVWTDPPEVSQAPIPPTGLPVLNTGKQLTTPNIRGTLAGVLYETNSHGCRDREYSDVPAPGIFRIVIAGDSFTAGHGVLGENAYPNVAERTLNEGLGRPHFEVINLGVSGQAMFFILARLESLGLELRPELVVYGLTLNDIEGAHYERTTNKFSFARQRQRYDRFRDSRSRALRILWPRLQSLYELIAPPPDSYLAELLHNYRPSTHAWRLFDGGFDRLAKIQNEQGIPVVVFIHTDLSYLNVFHPFRQIYEQIDQAARKRGLYVIQSFPGFLGEAPDRLWVSRHNLHPNNRGHEILADVLIRGLLEHRLLDPRPGTKNGGTNPSPR